MSVEQRVNNIIKLLQDSDEQHTILQSLYLNLYSNFIIILELKHIVVAIQWALVRTYWIDEPLD